MWAGFPFDEVPAALRCSHTLPTQERIRRHKLIRSLYTIVGSFYLFGTDGLDGTHRASRNNGAISRNHYSCLWSDICVPCRLLKRNHDSDGARALQKKQIPGNLERCHCPELLPFFGFETSIEDAQSLLNHDRHQDAGIEWSFRDSSQ